VGVLVSQLEHLNALVKLHAADVGLDARLWEEVLTALLPDDDEEEEEEDDDEEEEEEEEEAPSGEAAGGPGAATS
jgi:hypothetical protein